MAWRASSLSRTIGSVTAGCAALALQAGAAMAQTDAHADAADIIAASAVGAGFDAAIAVTFGECFRTNMTEAEALALIAAETVEDQQAVTSTIAAHDLAVACVAGALELE